MNEKKIVIQKARDDLKRRKARARTLVKQWQKFFKLDNWTIKVQFMVPSAANALVAIGERGNPEVLAGYPVIDHDYFEILIVLNEEVLAEKDVGVIIHEMFHCLIDACLGDLQLTFSEEQKKIFRRANERITLITEESLVRLLKKIQSLKDQLSDNQNDDISEEQGSLTDVSACCGADQTMLEGLPDEYLEKLGDLPEKLKIGICYAICDECDKPCEVIPSEEYLERILSDPNSYVSSCCGAEMKLSEMLPDFIGDDPKTQKVGTAHYICTKCEQACSPVLKED